MKYYQGKFKPINTDKYRGDWTNIIYRSSWELQVFKWCDANSNVLEWSSEELIIPYLYEVDRKYHRYFTDLKIKYKDGRVVIVEIKPKKQTQVPKNPSKSKRYINEATTYVKNMNKWKAASNYCKDRGWEFQIWTEDTLTEMGLIKKQSNKTLKPMKKLKPMSRKKVLKK